MRSLMTALLLVSYLAAGHGAQAAESITFPETGHTLAGRFLEYWQANGGLPQFGYPISAVVDEVGEDGQRHQVQYFERNRFELHPGNPRPYDVLLGRLGVASLARRGIDWKTLPTAAPASGCHFFPETGHNLCQPFLSYWQSHGGLPIYGFPISEAHAEVSPTDGRTYTVQYFERNRFEHHPENPAAYTVQLGLLGSEIYGVRPPAPAPALEPTLQRLLDLTNDARRKAGLGPVTLSTPLMSVAAHYSEVLAEQGRISHTGPDGSSIGDRISAEGYRWSFCAENLAAGYPSADEVFSIWMNSAGHRANLINANAREIGIGHAYRDGDPSRFGHYWVLVLAAPA